MNNDKINRFGSVLRFITPVIMCLVLFIVSDIRANVIKLETQLDTEIRYIEENYVCQKEYIPTIANIKQRVGEQKIDDDKYVTEKELKLIVKGFEKEMKGARDQIESYLKMLNRNIDHLRKGK